MGQIRIKYDPYWQQLEYSWRNAENSEWEPLNDRSKLRNGDKYEKGSLQSILPGMLPIIDEQYNYGKNDPLHIVFCGTDEDFDDFQYAFSAYYSADSTSKTKPVLKRDEEYEYPSADSTIQKLEEIFSSLEQTFNGQDKEIQEPIKKYREASSPVQPVCVIGTYSAGKSTFINALIGEELLPQASAQTTAKVFKIVHGKSIHIDFVYKNKKSDIAFENGQAKCSPSSSPDQELSDIFRSISDLKAETDIQCAAAVLSQLNASAGIDLINITVPFVDSSLPLETCSFEIYDTPGSDAASHPEHLNSLKSALRNRTNGLPVLITAPDSLDRTSVEDLKHTMEKETEALDIHNMIVVVNKADGPSMEELQKPLATSVITNWITNRFFFVSSIMALGSKKGCESLTDSTYRSTYRKNTDFFSNNAEEDYKSLPKANRLPTSRKQHICSLAAQAEKKLEELTAGSPEKELAQRELIAHNSGIRGVEDEIAYFARRYAAYNKCRTASGYLREAAEKAEEKRQRENAECQAKKEEQEKAFDKKYRELAEKIQAVAQKNKKAAQQLTYRLGEQVEGRISTAGISQSVAQICEKHKKDKSKETLRRELQQDFEKLLDETSQVCQEILTRFWQKGTEKIKEDVLFTITEEKTISETERTMLKQYVLEFPCVVPSEHLFDIRKKGLIKTKKILWIQMGEKVDGKEVSNTYTLEYKETRAEISQNFIREWLKAVERWLENFLAGMKNGLATLHEDLRQMQSDIDRLKEQIETLDGQINKLKDAGEQITQLTALQERKGNFHE